MLVYHLLVLFTVQTEIDRFIGHSRYIEVNQFEAIFDFNCVSDGDIVVCDAVVVQLYECLADVHDAPNFLFEGEGVEIEVAFFEVEKVFVSFFHEEIKFLIDFNFLCAIVVEY